jgi:ubiquinone/menaquinone biosynthesis C-methylase UbiE
MGQQEQWQLGERAPQLYERYLVPAMTAMWATDLCDRAALHPGERVLDAACGTGIVARVAAERVGTAGRVAALDLNPGMLVVARSLPAVTGSSIEWHEGSVLALPFPDAAFDVVLCQFGLQFFPHRPSALREFRRVLVGDGRLALNVFGPIEHNPATNALADALDRHIAPDASLAKRTEHALADPEEIRVLVSGAGFTDIEIGTVDKLVRFASVADYVRIQLTATPLASLIEGDDDRRKELVVEALVEDVASAMATYVGDDGLHFPQEVHVLLASR